MSDTRACTGCGVLKVGADFPPPKPSAKLRPRRRCRSCENAAERTRRKSGAFAEYSKRYRAAHPLYRREWNLRAKYGITQADYESMLAEQGGTCAVCKGPNLRVHKDGSTWFEVDHDHATGEVRGLLCWDCNIGLGRFMDSPVRLVAAAAYLQREA